MNTYAKRINIIVGQLTGIGHMIEKNDSCFEVLTQLKATKAALNSLTNKYLQEQFISCLEKGKEPKEILCKKFFQEILQ
jgi:DNA-binding FrmR family transcriptional regulator